MEDHLIDEIGSPEEQSNRENIRFTKNYGVGKGFYSGLCTGEDF